ncbi:MAG: hypothetical protein RLY43_1333 [Bacteroidota bacterium]
MFITNVTGCNFSKNDFYKCGKTRSDYLVHHLGQTLLSIDEKGQRVFVHSSELDNALKNLPMHIKLFCQ